MEEELITITLTPQQLQLAMAVWEKADRLELFSDVQEIRKLHVDAAQAFNLRRRTATDSPNGKPIEMPAPVEAK